MKTIKEAVVGVMKVKSIVTIALTLTFIYLAVVNQLTDQFMLIYTTVIAFYFGTQKERKEQNKTE